MSVDSTRTAPRRRRAGLVGAAIGLSVLILAAGTSGVAAASPFRSFMVTPGQTVTVHVDAATEPTAPGVPGVDSGVALAPDQRARITATGTATCHTPDATGCDDLDANGSSEPADAGFLAPGEPKFSLVGEVGNGPLTFIGTGPTTVVGSGQVQLGYNDDAYSDNSGGFDVTIKTCSVVSVFGQQRCVFLG